jgi:hypothetical protein
MLWSLPYTAKICGGGSSADLPVRLRLWLLGQPLTSGLAITAIGEPRADETTAAAHPEVADTRIAPYFLIIRAQPC